MFRIGQQVIVTRPHHKVKTGAVGTIIGYYQYREYYDDEDEDSREDWEEDYSEPLIRFNNPEDFLTPHQDWDNQEDCNHPIGTWYIDDCNLSEHFDWDKLEHTRRAIDNRHNEYKKRKQVLL